MIQSYNSIQITIIIESFSSENNIILDVPLELLHSTYMKSRPS